MHLTTGDKLSAKTRAEVLRAFGYRTTIENGYPGRNPCNARVAAISDAQWLADHAFYITKAGNLARNRHHAEPACMVTARRG